MPAKAELIVDLTKKQQAAIKPLIDKVIKGNETGKQVMLVAQVYKDHILVGTVSGEKMQALAAGNGQSATGRDRDLQTVTTR